MPAPGGGVSHGMLPANIGYPRPVRCVRSDTCQVAPSVPLRDGGIGCQGTGVARVAMVAE